MNVSYVLEGTGLKHGDQIRLTVQLIDAVNDKHIWSNSYSKNEAEIFDIYSEIAQQVAGEIGAMITREEKELIEKIPTKSQTAWDFWLQGRYLTYLGADKESLLFAQKLYRLSLEYDPKFSYPYVGIGFTWAFLILQNRIENSGYLDSINYYAEKALSLDPQDAAGYFLKGAYYNGKGNREAAIEQYDKATDISPSYTDPYEGRGWIYFGLGDYPNSIKNFHRITQLDRSNIYPITLRTIGYIYATAGFSEKAIESINEAFSIDHNTMVHYFRLAQSYSISGNARTANEYALKAFNLDSTKTDVLALLGKSY